VFWGNFVRKQSFLFAVETQEQGLKRGLRFAVANEMKKILLFILLFFHLINNQQEQGFITLHTTTQETKKGSTIP
jgi:hypothetical protein